MRPPARIKDT
jgi:ribonuclease HI